MSGEPRRTADPSVCARSVAWTAMRAIRQAGTRDTEYLELLRALVAQLVSKVQPDLIIYHVRARAPDAGASAAPPP